MACMKIITDDEKISRRDLTHMTKKMFGNFVKAVVDIKKEMIVIDAEMHADEEALLLQRGSKKEDIWGINLYPEMEGDDFIEFDSMINLRPSQGNRSRSVDNPEVRKKIVQIVNKLVMP